MIEIRIKPHIVIIRMTSSFLDQVIYPGKVTDAETFRIGNIGQLFPKDLDHLIKCIYEVLTEMDVPMPIVG